MRGSYHIFIFILNLSMGRHLYMAALFLLLFFNISCFVLVLDSNPGFQDH
jgi:hypothetical protein